MSSFPPLLRSEEREEEADHQRFRNRSLGENENGLIDQEPTSDWGWAVLSISEMTTYTFWKYLQGALNLESLASVRALTWKSLFLISVVVFRRISDIHTWSITTKIAHAQIDFIV